MQIITDFKQKFYTDEYFKFRAIAVGSAGLLGIFSILMGFSIFSALFAARRTAIFGSILARSFGILSLIIPMHLAYAAFILADKRWKPERIFYLSASIIPFMTLVAGFTVLRNFEVHYVQSAFLNFTGRVGFSMFIIFITVIEIFLLNLLKNFVFKNGRQQNSRRQKKILLPPPLEKFEPRVVVPATASAACRGARFARCRLPRRLSPASHLLRPAAL